MSILSQMSQSQNYLYYELIIKVVGDYYSGSV